MEYLPPLTSLPIIIIIRNIQVSIPEKTYKFLFFHALLFLNLLGFIFLFTLGGLGSLKLTKLNLVSVSAGLWVGARPNMCVFLSLLLLLFLQILFKTSL